jgi:hypothetical protein
MFFFPNIVSKRGAEQRKGWARIPITAGFLASPAKAGVHLSAAWAGDSW